MVTPPGARLRDDRPLLDGASAFPRSCLPLSPIVCLLVSLCWMACPPSPGSCLPLSPIVYPFLFPFVGWCVCLPEVLSPLVSLLVSLCWMACPPSGGFFTLVPVSHLVSQLVSPLVSQLVFLLASLCWMVCPPSFPRSCLPLSPIVCLLVSLCWMACPPSPGSCLPLSPIVYPFLFPFVGWRVRLPQGLVSLCLPLYTPSCFPLLDGVSAFPRLCLPLSPFLFPFVGWRARLQEAFSPLSLSPILFPSLSPLLSPSLSSFLLPFVGWCVRLPSRGLVSPCLPLSAFLFPVVGWCVRLPEALSPLVSLLSSLCWMVCPPSGGFFTLVPVSHLVSQLVSPLVSQLVFLLVSLCWMVCPPSRGLGSLVSQLVFQLVSQLVSELVSQLVSELVSQLVSHLVVQLVSQLVFLLDLLVSLCFSIPIVATKLAKPKNNTCEVVGTYCRHYRDSCRCYFMCWTCSSKHFSTHCLGSTAVYFLMYLFMYLNLFILYDDDI